MGYGNRPQMPNKNYSSNNTYNVKNSPKNNKTAYNGFRGKDEEDIYSPKVYAKKEKKKSSFYDLAIPEYEMDKQRMRNKRANDKKYKNKYR